MVVPFFIDAYESGMISVNGKIYNSDLIITADGIISDWRRKESHLLVAEDLAMIDWENIHSVFIGTGTNSQMKLAGALIEMLEGRRIPFVAIRTPVAVKEYNRFPHISKVGIFHLTC